MERIVEKQKKKSVFAYVMGMCVMILMLVLVGGKKVGAETIEVTDIEELADAINNANDGDAIVFRGGGELTDKVTIDKSITLQIDGGLIIKSNEWNITIAKEGKLDLIVNNMIDNSYEKVVEIENEGTLSISGNGVLRASASNSNIVDNKGILIINNGIKIVDDRSGYFPITGDTSNITPDGTFFKHIVMENYSYWQVSPIFSQSTSLDSQIALNIYADYDYAEGDEVKVKFSSDLWDEDIETSATGEKDDTYGYKFSVGIPAKNMGTDIDVALIIKHEGDEEAKVVATTTTSVKDYAEVIANGSSDYANLAKAMLNYGAKAQTFFGIDGEAVDNNIEFTEPESIDITPAYETAKGDDNFSYYGSSLLLKDKTVLRHYFKIEDKDASSYTFTVDGKALTPVQYAEDSKYFYIDVTGISADKLSEAYTVEVSKESNIVMTFKYGAYDYIYRALSIEDEKLVALCKAIYYYGEAANKQN